MEVHFGQIYIEEGAYFPFSCAFQTFISEKVTALVLPSPKFMSKYGPDFDLVFNVSAKHLLEKIEVRGPTVFKTTKDVEYTIFLPFNVIMDDPHPPTAALIYMFQGAYEIFDRLEIESTKVRQNQGRLIKDICSNSAMFEDIERLKRFNHTVAYLDPDVWKGMTATSSK